MAMTGKQQAAVAGGFIGACGIWILTQGSFLTFPTQGRAGLTGDRPAVRAELERRARAVPAGRRDDGGLWRDQLRLVDTELNAGHVDAAVRAWHDAYGAALESRSWESMIAVGAAFLEIGRAAGTPWGARMNAREAYLTALIRARRDRSVDGALRCAEAFAGLGERAIAEQSLYVAAQLAAGDEPAQQRVGEARSRWAGQQNVAGF